jgi:putative ABC transport system permease protein
LFTVTLLVTIGQLYRHNVGGVAQRLGGAAAVEVSSDATRPVPPRDVAHLPGVTRVTPTSAIDGRLQGGASRAPVAVTVVGFDSSFVGHGSPPVVGASDSSIATAANSSASIFDTVARDPTKVIVGTDVRSDRQSGLPGTHVRVGDVVELRDPLTGTTRALKVAGLVEQGRWGGADHVFAARAVVDRLSGGTASANLLYLETAAGTNNDVVAAVIDGTHLANGAFARSFRTLAAETLSAQRQFLEFGAGYAAVGLLADLAGIAVLMVDRIRERRRQIAMLRALGFRGITLQRAFRVESAVIASEGIVVGAFTGLVLAWRLGAGVALGRRLAFSPPVVPLGVIAVLVVVASLAATSVPARRAGRVQPAPALRGDE